MEETKVSYKFATDLLIKYYTEKYPGFNISANIYYDKRISEDAWGWDVEYCDFIGKVNIIKEENVLGEKIKLREPILLDDKEVRKILKEAFQSQLDKDVYEVYSVYPTKNYVGVSIVIKEKKLVK